MSELLATIGLGILGAAAVLLLAAGGLRPLVGAGPRPCRDRRMVERTGAGVKARHRLLRRNRRLYDVLFQHPWWDWGHRLMALVGQDFCGSWSEPTPRTWWYRLDTPKRQWRTGFPRHPLSTFVIVKNYDEFQRLTTGLPTDVHITDAGWHAICANQDGELHLGYQYWGSGFYGLTRWEMRLLAKYLRSWRRLDWWGARSWLYTIGLNAAVHRRKPFSCAVTPPRGSGGYDHWHCDLRRRHAGAHRYNNYEWSGDLADRVEFSPVDPS